MELVMVWALIGFFGMFVVGSAAVYAQFKS